MHYSDHSELELATDDYFIRWVKTPDAETDDFWLQWLKEHPGKQVQVDRARKLLLSVEMKAASWSDEDEILLKDKIMKSVMGQQLRRGKGQVISFNRPETRYWMVAAAIAGIVFLAALLWGLNPINQNYKTSYGQIEEVMLPDGSSVVMNANSSLGYTESRWSGNREVMLKGEAYFDVVKTPQNDAFIVIANNLKTEVLGTEFNVKARHSEISVVLHSGKVKLTLPQSNTGAEDAVYMNPGQLVEYSEEAKRVTRQAKVDTENYINWKKSVLVFNMTPLREVAEQVKDIYGIHLEMPEHVAEQTFSAKVQVKEGYPELLIGLISESFQLEMTAKEDTLIVKEAQGREK